VAADAGRPECWYAVTAPMLKAHSGNSQARLYRAAGAESWERVDGGLPQPFTTLPALAADRSSSGELYQATTAGEGWHSADYAAGWSRLPVELGPVWFRLLAI
jgi:hypothetical protein